MAIPFKILLKKNPNDQDAAPKFYPQLITMGQTATLETISYDMKEASSLSVGDIKSVLANFVVAMRRALYNGHSVNIAGFGVFRLIAHCEGAETTDTCSAKNIKSVKIQFRSSASVRPSLTARNEGDVMSFVDVTKLVEGKEENAPVA